MQYSSFLSMCVAVALILQSGLAQSDGATSVALRIREVTVFKDGHAFVMSSGDMPVTSDGKVVLEQLPSPVLGTFWPYSASPSAKLVSVVAGRRRVAVTRTAIDVRALVEANLGADVVISEKGDKEPLRYPATILSIPTRTPREQDSTDPAEGADRLPIKAAFFLARVADGIRTVNFDRVLDVTFKGEPKSTAMSDEIRNSLTLQLKTEGNPPEKAPVGIMYLQHGLRWIPAYKVDIDGKGQAQVKLEATLVNDLADLNDVTLNLVVGVPTFDFKDTQDPMALQSTLARVSNQSPYTSQLSNSFSNAIMTQSAGDRYDRREGAATPEDTRIMGSGRAEDLFVYNLAHVTLRRGERMVVPVAEFSLPYEDVYTFDVAQAPPTEVRQHFNSNQQAELAKLLQTPKAMHKLRLTNSSAWPLTTAPALIVSGNRPLAQGTMTYTAVGARVDLPVTTAVDVSTKHIERELGRTPNASYWRGDSLHRVDLEGTLSLTNRKAKTVTIEISRTVCGIADTASNDGKIEQLSWLSDWESATDLRIGWRSWYSWPQWWGSMNGIGRFSWSITLAPGASMDLSYTSHYFWR